MRAKTVGEAPRRRHSVALGLIAQAMLPRPAGSRVAFSIERDAYRAKEVEGLVKIAVVRKGGDALAATVRIASVDGSAKAGRNYVEVDEVLVFNPFETRKEVTVYIFDSPDNETYTFEVELREPQMMVGPESFIAHTGRDRSAMFRGKYRDGAQSSGRQSAGSAEVDQARGTATIEIVDVDQKGFAELLLRSVAFQFLVFCSTAFALFGNDLFIVYGSRASDDTVNAITMLNIAVFSLELILMMVVRGRAYCPSIQLVMDLLAIFGLVALLPQFVRALGSGGGIGVLARAGRAARVAGKAGRTIKVPQLLGKMVQAALVMHAYVKKWRGPGAAAAATTDDKEGTEVGDTSSSDTSDAGGGGGEADKEGVDRLQRQQPSFLEKMGMRQLKRVEHEIEDEITAATSDAMVDTASRAGLIGATLLDLLTSKVILMMLLLLVCSEFLQTFEVPTQKQFGLDALELLARSDSEAAFAEVMAQFKAPSAPSERAGTEFNTNEPLLYLRVAGSEHNEGLETHLLPTLRDFDLRAVASPNCSFGVFDAYEDLVRTYNASTCPSAAIFDNSASASADAVTSMLLTAAIVVILSIGMGLMAVDFREKLGEPMARVLDTLALFKSIVFGGGDDAADDSDSDSGDETASESDDSEIESAGKEVDPMRSFGSSALPRLRRIFGSPDKFRTSVEGIHATYEKIYQSMLTFTCDLENTFSIRMTEVRNRLIMRNQELQRSFEALEDAAMEIAQGRIKLVDMSGMLVNTSRLLQGVAVDAILASREDEPDDSDSEGDGEEALGALDAAGELSIAVDTTMPALLRRMATATDTLEETTPMCVQFLEGTMKASGAPVPNGGVTLGSVLAFAEATATGAVANAVGAAVGRLAGAGMVGERVAALVTGVSVGGAGPGSPVPHQLQQLRIATIKQLDAHLAGLIAEMASEKLASLKLEEPSDAPLVSGAGVAGRPKTVVQTLALVEHALAHNAALRMRECGVDVSREALLQASLEASGTTGNGHADQPSLATLTGLAITGEAALTVLAADLLAEGGEHLRNVDVRGMSPAETLRAAACEAERLAAAGPAALERLPEKLRGALADTGAGCERLVRFAALARTAADAGKGSFDAALRQLAPSTDLESLLMLGTAAMARDKAHMGAAARAVSGALGVDVVNAESAEAAIGAAASAAADVAGAACGVRGLSPAMPVPAPDADTPAIAAVGEIVNALVDGVVNLTENEVTASSDESRPHADVGPGFVQVQVPVAECNAANEASDTNRAGTEAAETGSEVATVKPDIAVAGSNLSFVATAAKSIASHLARSSSLPGASGAKGGLSTLALAVRLLDEALEHGLVPDGALGRWDIALLRQAAAMVAV